MLRLSLVSFVCLWVLVNSKKFSVYETEQNIKSHGYPAETHHVTTSDGYILEMHRIPHGKNQVYSSDRPVVFLMHGLLAASNCFIYLGADLAPAYNLADAGFDVWMGNARGNRNSRRHIYLNPDDSTQKTYFFDFTWEEIATVDLPTMIDYTLSSTHKEKLHYIGHSQGGTVFFVLLSMKPEYNEKIESAHLWAGVGYMNHFPSAELVLAAKLTDTIYNVAVLAGRVELYPPDESDSRSSRQADNCGGNPAQKYLCQHLIGVRNLLGKETQSASTSDSAHDDYEVAGASLKQIAHYGQNIRDNSFRRWNYGLIQNVFAYGSINPTLYNLGLIKTNVTMHYTVNDDMLDERDVLAMADDIPNAKVRKVPRDSFTHVDFVFASDAKALLFDYVIEALRHESGLE